MHQCGVTQPCQFAATMPDKDTPMFPASSEPATRTVVAAWPSGLGHLGLATAPSDRAPLAVGEERSVQAPCRIEAAPQPGPLPPARGSPCVKPATDLPKTSDRH